MSGLLPAHIKHDQTTKKLLARFQRHQHLAPQDGIDPGLIALSLRLQPIQHIGAFAAMVIALIFGIPAALALDRAQFPGKALFRRLVLLPLILPGIITGLSLLMLFRVANVKLSLLTIILGHGTALISVATTEVFAGLQKLNRAQEEASLDLGANYWQTFWRITVPDLKLSIIGAALLIFTLSMDEIAVSFFLIGRDNTLPLEIWGRLRRGITPEINAISTIIFLFSLIAIVVWYRLRTRAEGAEIAAPLVEPSVEHSA